MRSRSAVVLGLAGVLGTWVASSWAPFTVPVASLATVIAAVLGGRTTGVVVAAAMGTVLDLASGSLGPWLLALTGAALAVDWLHRETLTHHTPASAVLHATVATGVTLVGYWLLAWLSARIGSTVPVPTFDAAIRSLSLALVEAALLASTFRFVRRFATGYRRAA